MDDDTIAFGEEEEAQNANKLKYNDEDISFKWKSTYTFVR